MNFSGKTGAVDELSQRLERYVEAFASAYGIPGLSVGVVIDGEAFLVRGFGGLCAGTGKHVDKDSVFHAASVSKTFTATAVMQLAERGKLSLDAGIASVLPGFSMKDDRYKNITIRQLLCHTSGMPDVADYHWDKPEYDDGALGRFVATCSDLNLLEEPGVAFSYSNIGYEILGHLVAVVSGVSFESFVHQNIFVPLGMSSSTFEHPKVPESVRAMPHLRARSVNISPVFPYNRAHAPSSTLQTSAHDLTRWALCNLRGGELGSQGSDRPGSQKILSRQSHGSMLLPFAETGRGRELVGSVGAAWFLGTRNGVRTVSHAGRDTGFSSIIILAPESGTASCVMCNLSPVPVESLGLGILDLALGHEPEVPRRPAIIECMESYNTGGKTALRVAYETLLGASPDAYDFSTGYLLSLAEAALEAGDTTLAIDVLNLGIIVEPVNAKIHEMLARVHFMSGDLASAAASAARSLEIDPSNLSLAARMSMLKDSGGR